MSRFYLPPKLQLITINSPESVGNYYIYQWRDGYKIFYIGVGANRRAWNTHLPLPEKRKQEADNFMVEIIRQNLTKKQAHGIERLYIIDCLKRGCKLLNGKIPSVSPIPQTRTVGYHHLSRWD